MLKRAESFVEFIKMKFGFYEKCSSCGKLIKDGNLYPGAENSKGYEWFCFDCFIDLYEKTGDSSNG